MKDRIPTPGQEGRMLITPENGDPPFYATVAMADNPSEDGTPLHKATLLKDATAALFGLDETAVPNTVFEWLGKYNQYWWTRMATTSHWEIQIEAAKEITFEYFNLKDNQIVYGTDAAVGEDGAITLLNQSKLTLTSTQNEWETAFRSLVGKYAYFPTWVSEEEPSAARPYFINAITAFEIEKFTGGYSIIFTGAQPVTSVWVDGSSGVWTYVQASDRDAYPDFGIEGNYEYKYLGVPFEKLSSSAAELAPANIIGILDGYNGTEGVTVNLGKQPKMVIIGNKIGFSNIITGNSTGSHSAHTVAMPGYPGYHSYLTGDLVTSGVALEVTKDGFTLNAGFKSNLAPYFYLALM